MSKSYRIRTTPGVDKSINVLIDQDFEYLEILSLKLLQSEIYTRQCSDYGVVVGRVSVNNGFGIPNAKVSVFIPLDSEDETNPIISELYPYKTLNDINEDGYRYNLLPYTQSHSGHQPTGTFFDREDVLTNPTLIEVFDKYYKYTATTNESGDYMIFGVPTGSHQLVMDVDLSDIGEFSLSPQDLVRMGVATESQVSGTKFKTDENLRSLPQIVNINKTIQVEPLWGQEEICDLGINRSDFDLSSELNIDIRPTSVFMGSIVSTADGDVVKRNCKTKNKAGSLCSLVTGPGEILAIRQTIGQDDLGRPVLETFDLEGGGVVIDDNGTWLIDVPMNLDYVTTNEFGEQVLSNDPEVGIPTSGKYRFKVKWAQSPSLSEPVKRGYFLVPNVKEYGWGNDATQDPAKAPIGSPNRTQFDKSYAFSLDWDDYANIQDSIDCKDTFYPMKYNKVYTVSQLVDQYRKGYAANKFIGIKNILDDTCDSKVNKFPSNDAVFRFDLIYFLFWIMLFLFTPIFLVLIPVVHILYLVLFVLVIILCPILIIVIGIVSIICNFLKLILGLLKNLPRWLGGRTFKKWYDKLNCPKIGDGVKMCAKLKEGIDKLKNIKIPNLSYPECSFCDCGEPEFLPTDGELASELAEDFEDIASGLQQVETSNSLLSAFQITSSYLNQRDFSPNPSNGQPGVYSNDSIYQELFAGEGIGNADSGTLTSSTRIPGKFVTITDDTSPDDESTGVQESEYHYFTSSLTLSERLNLFNNKSKYYDDNIISNPGGGVNRIKVSFEPTLNPGQFHYDNVIAIVCNSSTQGTLTEKTIVSFQDTQVSTDVNLTGDGTTINQFGSYSITGTTINNGSVGSPASVTISYANPNNNGSNIPVTYNVVQDETTDPPYARFPMDIEYLQVIKNMSYVDYMALINGVNISGSDWDSRNSFGKRILSNNMSFYRIEDTVSNYSLTCPNPTIIWSSQSREFNPIEYFSDFEEQRVVFMVRGVDPNSSRINVEYDLSRLFGYDFGNSTTIFQGDFKMNHPIKGSYVNVNHNTSSNLTSDFYYDSFHFVPSQGTGQFNFSSFTTNLHTYYSNTDTTNTSFKPDTQGSTPTLGVVTDSSGGVLRVKNSWVASPLNYTSGAMGSNGFIVEWKNPSSQTLFCVLGSPSVYRRNGDTFLNNNYDRNRGYYPNEIVNGGTLFYQKPQITNGFGNTPNQLINHYYSSKYPSTLSLNIDLSSTDNKKIVMRSDRLPTSTEVQDNINNSFMLHSNSNFLIVTFTDDGTSQIQSTAGTGSNALDGDSNLDYSSAETADEPAVLTNVIDSFKCGKMAPLGCYYEDNGEIKIRNSGDDCWSFGGGKDKMKNGCYVLITQPFISLLKDFLVVIEWKNRVQTIFGACRNVFSHLFTNNWVNGTLYAFTFKNDVFYDSLNQPESNICEDVVILHSPSNNLYYRSSPWDAVNQKFIGHDANNNYGGNFRYLKYPTTIMDLGPRTDYIQELVMSDDYDGYVVKKLESTSYGDVSELLNLLIVTRLTNMNILTQISTAGIITFFSRTKTMIDGDYAQMNAINSQLGVSPFESTNYAWTSPGQDPIFYKSGSVNNALFGIFFSSDTQTRDFISPKRTIINPTLTATDACAFSNFDVFSQEVPFYQWNIKSSNFIFGTQENDWYTSPIDGGGYFTHKYQSLDRLNPTSRYFRTNGSPQTQFDKGYIYAVNGNTQDDLSADIVNWDLNSSPSSVVTTGAPFYFYFGLNKGKSAFDRFRQKWINTEIIID